MNPNLKDNLANKHVHEAFKEHGSKADMEAMFDIVWKLLLCFFLENELPVEKNRVAVVIY